jgi:hypothetical protein
MTGPMCGTCCCDVGSEVAGCARKDLLCFCVCALACLVSFAGVFGVSDCSWDDLR